MKIAVITMAAALFAALILLMPACASRNEALDPVLVQKEIAQYRAQEIDLVRSTVLDRERAERLIELLGKRDQLVSDSVEKIHAYRKEMAALNVDYHAKRASFDMLMANFNHQREVAQHKFVALIETMKKAMTASEWKIISRFQLKRQHPRELTYGQQSGEV